METATSDSQRPAVGLWTLPNQLTVGRLALSVVLFFCMGYGAYAASFVIFIVAASTDWLDGYYARRYGLVTTLGRILDPFADKLIICGTFIFLAAIPGSGVAAWVAVLIMARELLVTALRGLLEQRGINFSAEMSGKIKMVVQCVAAGMSLFLLAFEPSWLIAPLTIAVWAAVVMTVYSGLAYILRARRLFAE
ncbi:MAG: CDP-diacylglycerol--glycerol-3-phosphate 3-phosphatidyltransferase [Planctomycetaceae bacterium]|nr:CDP-diacylglycerol--glycerol-3-phosphate 3-phosphatidyltransferase [Planctomycetaceae bacterium]